jgi:hypothetical protein
MSGTIRPGESAAPSAAARAELARFAASVDAAGEWEATVAAFGTYYHEGFDFDPWRHVAFRIERCVAEGRPASFIRLGDAEGNLLALSLDDFPALANHCASALSCLYFGRPDALALAAPEVLPPLQTAVKNADVVGFPGPFGGPILLQQAVDTYVRPIQGLLSVQRYLRRNAKTLKLAAKVGAPAGFHRGLLPHYRALIRGRRIGIVTCRSELAEALEKRMGAAAVDLRSVPQQAILSDPEADTGHWPTRYRQLTAELRDIEPGMLWLVAAGTFGKVYCEVIREAGGVALDIGHIADVWAGIRSRAFIRPKALEAWRIVDGAGSDRVKSISG